MLYSGRGSGPECVEIVSSLWTALGSTPGVAAISKQTAPYELLGSAQRELYSGAWPDPRHRRSERVWQEHVVADCYGNPAADVGTSIGGRPCLGSAGTRGWIQPRVLRPRERLSERRDHGHVSQGDGACLSGDRGVRGNW